MLTPALCPRSMDKDSPDVHQDLNTLKTKFQEMRKVVSTMPGIHLSPRAAAAAAATLREQVQTKNELLQKYKSLCMFEILRSDEPNSQEECWGTGVLSPSPVEWLCTAYLAELYP